MLNKMTKFELSEISIWEGLKLERWKVKFEIL